MADFENIFASFKECSLQWLERKLISELFPIIKEIIANFAKTIPEYGKCPSYDEDYIDTTAVSDFKEKIERIVKVLDSSDQKREDFLRNFPGWEKQRKQSIAKLQNIADYIRNVRIVSNGVKIAAGSIGAAGGAAILLSVLFPPAAPALLPSWLGGAAASALLPSIFLGAAPTVSTLAVVGGVAAAGGAVGNVGATVTELVLTEKGKDEAKEIIAEDRRRMEQLGLFGFWVELNDAVDDLFGKSTASKILEDLIDFLNNVPPILDDIQPILKPLHTCLKLILPGITKFLLVGISLASVILSIFFVVFLIRRHGWAILIHRHVLGFVSAVDAGVEITRLIAAAGLSGSELGELIPRQLAGRIAVGATAAVGIVLDIATIVISSIDLAKGSLSDEASMISEIINNLKTHLEAYQRVNNELKKCERVVTSETFINFVLYRNPQKRHPSIIIYNIPNSIEESEIHKSIKTFTKMDVNLNLRFKLKGRRENTSHWIFEAPGEVFRKIEKGKKIPINRMMYYAKEFFDLRICNICQAFGHTSKQCPETTPVCRSCGGQHFTKKCKSKLLYCINCSKSNERRKKKFEIHHRAMSFDCPLYKIEIDKYRKSINYK
ncbi:unnamed protein product [Larinioides sclopetarius]|uniref:CCHC-type domain-containing protein n=1 Tax=Larinioides sclopetarius TaxID=280406 RepID=A0AAV1Z1D1_9ARAC